MKPKVGKVYIATNDEFPEYIYRFLIISRVFDEIEGLEYFVGILNGAKPASGGAFVFDATGVEPETVFEHPFTLRRAASKPKLRHRFSAA